MNISLLDRIDSTSGGGPNQYIYTACLPRPRTQSLGYYHLPIFNHPLERLGRHESNKSDKAFFGQQRR